MSLVVVIEERAGQHSSLQPTLGKLRYCECRGPVERGTDTCLRCGKYVRRLFRVAGADREREAWEQLVRERAA